MSAWNVRNPSGSFGVRPVVRRQKSPKAENIMIRDNVWSGWYILFAFPDDWGFKYRVGAGSFSFSESHLVLVWFGLLDFLLCRMNDIISNVGFRAASCSWEVGKRFLIRIKPIWLCCLLSEFARVLVGLWGARVSFSTRLMKIAPLRAPSFYSSLQFGLHSPLTYCGSIHT